MLLKAKPKCVRCFKLLAVKSRYTLLNYLSQAKRSVPVTALVALTKLRQPTVTFHLNKLAEVGLVQRRRSGRNVLCSASRRCRVCPLFAD